MLQIQIYFNFLINVVLRKVAAKWMTSLYLKETMKNCLPKGNGKREAVVLKVKIMRKVVMAKSQLNGVLSNTFTLLNIMVLF